MQTANADSASPSRRPDSPQYLSVSRQQPPFPCLCLSLSCRSALPSLFAIVSYLSSLQNPAMKDPKPPPIQWQTAPRVYYEGVHRLLEIVELSKDSRGSTFTLPQWFLGQIRFEDVKFGTILPSEDACMGRGNHFHPNHDEVCWRFVDVPGRDIYAALLDHGP